MGQLTPTTQLCIPTTGELINYFGKNTPEGRENDGFGFMQFLKSQTNTAGLRRLSDSITGVPGKLKGVRLAYDSPMCFKVCPSPFNCQETSTPYSPPMEFVEYEIESRFVPCDGEGETISLSLNPVDYARYCEMENRPYFEKRVVKFDYKFIQELNKMLIASLQTMITTPVKTFPILYNNPLTGQRVVNDELPLWIEELISDAKMNIDDYIAIGGQMVNLMRAKFGVGTLSAEGATRVTSAFPDLYYDRNFDSVFGKNALVLIPKGAFQFVEWTEYKGENQFKDQRLETSTKLIPLGNGSFQEVDYKWKFDPECKTYDYLPSVYAELVKAIGGGCDLDDDTDGIFIIKDCSNTLTPTC